MFQLHILMSASDDLQLFGGEHHDAAIHDGDEIFFFQLVDCPVQGSDTDPHIGCDNAVLLLDVERLIAEFSLLQPFPADVGQKVVRGT